MRLWTIQPKTILKEINNKGIFYCNEKLAKNIEDGSFKPAYDWLVNQMEKRLLNSKKPNNVNYPIWSWYLWNGENCNPSSFLEEEEKEKYVCIELDIPEEHVLLSDFGEWHAVLNDFYLDNSMNEEEWNKEMEYYDNLPFEKKEKIKRKSWENIFIIEKVKNEWREKGYYVQATFWLLKKEWIKEISYFTN